MTRENSQSFMKGSAILMLSMIIVKAVGALFKIPLTNMLGATGMSYFSSAYNIYVLIYALSVTGLSSALSKKVAELRAKQKYAEVKLVFRISLLLFFIIGLAGTVAIFLSGGLFSNLIGSKNTMFSLFAIAPAVLFCSVMAAYRGYYEGLCDMKPTAVVQVVEVLSKLIFGLIFAYLGKCFAVHLYESKKSFLGYTVFENTEVQVAPFAAAGAMIGITISTLFGLFYLLLKYYKRGGDKQTPTTVKKEISFREGKALCKDLVFISIPITLSAVMVQLSAVIDTVTIRNSLLCANHGNILTGQYASFLKMGEPVSEMLFGVFSSCITLYNVIPAFCGVFAKSALPKVANAWTVANRTEMSKSILQVLKASTVVSAPIGFGLLFMARPILTFAYKNHPDIILIGTPIMQIIAAGGIFLALAGSITAILQGIGKPKLPLYAFAAGAVFKMLLNILLVGNNTMNIYGAAVATLLSNILVFFFCIVFLIKNISVKIDYFDAVLKPAICGIVCGVATAVLYFSLTKLAYNSIITLLSIGFGGIIYLISLFLSRTITFDVIKLLFQKIKRKST